MPETIRQAAEVSYPDSARSGPYGSYPYTAGQHCPDCGRDRFFAQHHDAAGWCPDTADRYCPEWYCLSCGAALLIADSVTGVPAASAAASARVGDRVA
jgi:hypothetical protein